MSEIDTCRKLTVPALLKRTCPFIFIFLYSLSLAAQTSNISGIVNTYHKVIQIIPSKSCLRVADPTGLVVNTRVMVVQMKGATIDINNTSAFGDTIALNGAGNYEIGTICYIIGDSIFLFHDLLNSYDSSAKVQLVQFAEYTSANVIGTVKALSWDSVASVGGVIAIYAEQDITLNAPIYADSSGYAGGIWYNNTPTCDFFNPAGTGWAYDITSTTSQNGAYKGESIANIALTQNSAKGAPANGGGGGNNHNNSGGGGANLVAGGNGGGNGSTVFFCNTGGNYGRAGKALSSWSGTKIFMGGGAGAGHANNGSATFNYGGNGGGIVFIWCDNLIGNNYSISANGGNGGASQSDGAGGGGGGGTIIMNASTYSNVSITANGGSGGQSDDGGLNGRCFGGGGGGSGGAIYFTGSTPAVTVSANGGAGGIEINGSNCGTLVPSAAGSNGSIIPNYTFSRSFDPAGYCLMLLPSKLIYFNGQSTQKEILLSWKLDHPELAERFIVEKKNENNEWVALASVNAGNNSFYYSASDIHPFMGNNFYRLKVIEKNGPDYFSETRKIWFADATTDFTIYPNPSRGKVYINGSLAPGEMLQLIDIHGRTVWQTRIRNNRQESIAASLQPGIYLVRHNGITKKLVIH